MTGWYSPYATPYTTAADPGAATRDRAAAGPLPEDPDPGEPDDRAGLLAHRRARRRARARRLAIGAAGLAGLLIVWQLAAMLLNDDVALPSVTQTVAQFVHYLNRPYPAEGKPIWYDLYISLRRILIGFSIGVIGGVALGAAMS